MKFDCRGGGPSLLLIHGLGGSRRSWDTIASQLAEHRRVVAIDLPGHGASAVEAGSGTFAGLAGSVERFIADEGLAGIDVVGSSMGARIALELARRGGVGDVVALDPGGFWQGWERGFFRVTIGASVRLLRLLEPVLPAIARSTVGRTLLLAQLSARPWHLGGDEVAAELVGYATTPTFDALVRDLASGKVQRGPAAADAGRIALGWGRRDRLCLARQARRALAAFPSAELRWFEHSGHFPAWDEPGETVDFILGNTASGHDGCASADPLSQLP